MLVIITCLRSHLFSNRVNDDLVRAEHRTTIQFTDATQYLRLQVCKNVPNKKFRLKFTTDNPNYFPAQVNSRL